MDPASRSLELQAELAPEFVAGAWPAAQEQAAAAGELPSAIGSILICGCGDSHHAAVSLEMALAAATSCHVRAAPSMEAARYLLPRFAADPGSLLLIAVSASGEVARTLEAVELGRRSGAQTLALTTRRQSSLAQAAHRFLALPLPAMPEGPGLVSYLASLLMGYALAERWAQPGSTADLGPAIRALADRLPPWIAAETDRGRALAEDCDPADPTVFLGSGPAYGSAMFAAAKLIEAAGVTARGQDVEEWAHLEYFCDPPDQALWLLTAAGRAADREHELIAAAEAIGRRVQISRWTELPQPAGLRELLAPLALWAGPAAFAARRMEQLGQRPFRGFGGGRNRDEGGAPSRIRSSRRWSEPASGGV